MSGSDSGMLLEADRAGTSVPSATGSPEQGCCMCSTGFPTGEVGSEVDSRSTSSSNGWARKAPCLSSTQLGSTGGIEEAISDSWSSASSFIAAGSGSPSEDSHPVSVAQRCAGDRFWIPKRVKPQFSAMTSFCSTWSRSHRGTGLRDPSTMDKKLAHSGAYIAVFESSGT